MSPFQRNNSHESKNSFQWEFVARKVMSERDLLRRKVIQLEAELQIVRSVSPESNMRPNMSAYR
jgi:hypothetical protein